MQNYSALPIISLMLLTLCIPFSLVLSSNQLVLKVFTDKGQYQLDEQVVISIYLFNNNTENINLALSSNTIFGFKITDINGNFSYSNLNSTSIMTIYTLNLPSYNYVNKTFYWVATRPGDYILMAFIIGHPEINATTTFKVMPFRIQLWSSSKMYYQDQIAVVYASIYGDFLNAKQTATINFTLQGLLTNYKFFKLDKLYINFSYYKNIFEYKLSDLKPDYYHSQITLVYGSDKITNSYDFIVDQSTERNLKELNIRVLSNFDNQYNYSYMYIILNKQFSVYDLLYAQISTISSSFYLDIGNYKPLLSVNLRQGEYVILVMAFKSNISNEKPSSFYDFLNKPIFIVGAAYSEIYLNGNESITLFLKSPNDAIKKSLKSLEVNVEYQGSNVQPTLLYFDMYYRSGFLLNASNFKITVASSPAIIVAYSHINNNDSKVLLGAAFLDVNDTESKINLSEIYGYLPPSVYSYQLPELEVYTVTETSYTTTTILLPQTTTSFINTSFVASENVYPILVALAISLAVTVIVAVVLNRKT